MVNSNATLSLFASLILAVAVVIWLSRQLSLRIQHVVQYTTRSKGLSTGVLFLALWPGVFVHETAHWLMARLVGLRTGKFRVWPKIQGKQIGMGSVNVERGNAMQDSLVGLAPLLLGSVLIALLGQRVFSAGAISGALLRGAWGDGFAIFWQVLTRDDGLLWGYLLFSIANSMTPSDSDRAHFQPFLLYSGLALLIYFVLDLPLAPFTTALNWLTPLVQTLLSGLIFVILLDGLIWLCLYLFVLFLDRRAPLYY
jgi:hypothetical protein